MYVRKTLNLSYLHTRIFQLLESNLNEYGLFRECTHVYKKMAKWNAAFKPCLKRLIFVASNAI